MENRRDMREEIPMRKWFKSRSLQGVGSVIISRKGKI